MNPFLIIAGLGLILTAIFSRREQEYVLPMTTKFIDWAQQQYGKLTRGERNNNPGNIERGSPWLGLSPDQSGDSRFAVFEEPIYGIRALAKLLLNYQRIHGLQTVEQIINRYAPPSENVTQSYVQSVANRLGVSPRERLNLSDPNTLMALTSAIIHHENGRVIYPREIIAQGVYLALGQQAPSTVA
jgi:hypothetical protein